MPMPNAGGGVGTNFVNVSPMISVGGTAEGVTNYIHVGAASLPGATIEFGWCPEGS